MHIITCSFDCIRVQTKSVIEVGGICPVALIRRFSIDETPKCQVATKFKKNTHVFEN